MSKEKSKEKGGGGGGPSKKSEKGGANEIDQIKTENKFQAVVLADSFSKVKFRPLTLERPKVLLPLGNIPMLDYCLEMLVSGGVEEIFVFCASHASVVAEYLSKTSSWPTRAPHVSVKCVVAENVLSAGDALRRLDQMDVIKGHFVLISGDVISTINLQKVLQQHKERVALDKSNLMTIVLKKAGAPRVHRTRALDDDLIVVLDEYTSQILSYENSLTQTRSQPISTNIIQNHSSFKVRYDLMDTHIDICTPEVLMLFTDNFDYQDIRHDFVRGVLGSDVLGNKIYAHVISGEYAARLKDLRTYDSVSKDVIHRWTYPMVPDNNLLADTTYTYSRGCQYKEQERVTLERGCQLGEDVIFGAGSSCGAGTIVRKSVIGRDCIIGKNCTITGSYLFGKVTVEDGVKIDRAILADGVIVRKKAVIERGVVLSFNVIIGEAFRVEPYKLITRATLPSSQLGDQAPPPEGDVWNPAHVGRGGSGRIYDPLVEEEGEDDDDDGINMAKFHINSLAPDLEGYLEACANLYVDTDPDSPKPSPDVIDSYPHEDGEYEQVIEDPVARFTREVADTLRRGRDENLQADGIVLELTSLKLSHDATMKDFFYAIIKALFDLIELPAGTDKRTAFQKLGPNTGKGLHANIKRWEAALKKFSKQKNDQITLIIALEELCLSDAALYVGLFTPTLQMLYDKFDLLSEDAILEWESKRADKNSPLLKQAQEFLTWLKEADEED